MKYILFIFLFIIIFITSVYADVSEKSVLTASDQVLHGSYSSSQSISVGANNDSGFDINDQSSTEDYTNYDFTTSTYEILDGYNIKSITIVNVGTASTQDLLVKFNGNAINAHDGSNSIESIVRYGKTVRWEFVNLTSVDVKYVSTTGKFDIQIRTTKVR